LTNDYLYHIIIIIMTKFEMDSSMSDLLNMTDEILQKIKQIPS